jgi:hypothetical protein
MENPGAGDKLLLGEEACESPEQVEVKDQRSRGNEVFLGGGGGKARQKLTTGRTK